MSNPVISICMATFRRADYIGATLESLAAQAGTEVELIIVDGSPDDATEKIVAGYRDRFSRLHYERQPPRGVDADFGRAAELAQGEYCWFFSDDDLLKPGAVATVLARARTGRYDLIVVDAEVWNADFTRCLEKSRMGLAQDREFAPADFPEFFRITINYLSFIGGVVIKRSVWQARDKTPYMGTEFAHIGAIYQRPLAGPVLALAEPLIQIRHGNAQWTARRLEVFVFRWPALVWSFPHCPDSVKQQVVPREYWRRWRTLLLYRGYGAYGPAEYHKYIAALRAPWWDKAAAWVIARVPGRACQQGLLRYMLWRGRLSEADVLSLSRFARAGG